MPQGRPTMMVLVVIIIKHNPVRLKLNFSGHISAKNKKKVSPQFAFKVMKLLHSLLQLESNWIRKTVYLHALSGLPSRPEAELSLWDTCQEYAMIWSGSNRIGGEGRRENIERETIHLHATKFAERERTFTQNGSPSPATFPFGLIKVQTCGSKAKSFFSLAFARISTFSFPTLLPKFKIVSGPYLYVKLDFFFSRPLQLYFGTGIWAFRRSSTDCVLIFWCSQHWTSERKVRKKYFIFLVVHSYFLAWCATFSFYFVGLIFFWPGIRKSNPALAGSKNQV